MALTEATLTERHRKRFWAKVAICGEDECWLWQGHVSHNGYGRTMKALRGEKKTMAAHRIAWALAGGRDVPTGMVVCHSCDVPACCNPRHLWVGTHAENIADRDRKGHTARGARSGRSKLTPSAVRLIRGDERNVATKLALAHKYGVSRAAIYAIWNGLSWGWLKDGD